ncbi:MAG: DNA polymerase III subunit delta, partial [Proteobacteria bacterium]|nr:DNA polymerase III subunit delta [Pseudomonadota bacterium]
EPFQIGEITTRIKNHFIKSEESAAFVFESFDGERLDGAQLLASLEMLPGLFDEPGSIRLVRCENFEKVPAATLETLKPYFENPSPSTVFLITASKLDKRKSWVKAVQDQGMVVEVSEPYDREWPKWQSYFERKCGKKIESPAWEYLVEFSGKALSFVWQEMQKAAIYVGEKQLITQKDVEALLSSSLRADIFQFAEDVIAKRKFATMKGFEALKLEGESEIKILSILVRQFRMVERCQKLMKEGIKDPKILGPQIGTHPFFVGKIQELAKAQSSGELERGLHLLADLDYQLKTGQSRLFEGFLTKYLSAQV